MATTVLSGSPQVATPVYNKMLFKVSGSLIAQPNIALMQEWSKWLAVDKVVNDDPSEYPNHPSFIDHRHDQSVLTNLALLHGLPMVVVPSVHCNARPKP